MRLPPGRSPQSPPARVRIRPGTHVRDLSGSSCGTACPEIGDFPLVWRFPAALALVDSRLRGNDGRGPREGDALRRCVRFPSGVRAAIVRALDSAATAARHRGTGRAPLQAESPPRTGGGNDERHWLVARAGVAVRSEHQPDHGRSGAGRPPAADRHLRARARSAGGGRGNRQDHPPPDSRAWNRRRVRTHRGYRRSHAERPSLLYLAHPGRSAARRARAVAQARSRSVRLLLQRDQPRPAAGPLADAAGDGRAQRRRLQCGAPLSSPPGLRRPQPDRARGDVRPPRRGAGPLLHGDHGRDAVPIGRSSARS